MTGPTLPPLTGVASLDTTPFRKGARDALNVLREVVDYAKKQGTLTLTAKLSGASSAAIRKTITDAIGTDTLSVKLTFNPASVATAIRDLRTALSAVVGINVSTLSTLQVQINAQITQLTALIAQLRAAGGGSGGGGRGGAGAGLSANTQKLLADLEALNNQFKRGDVSLSDYSTKLAGLQSALRVSASLAQQGSAEFKALDAAVTRTNQGFRNIETRRLAELTGSVAAARAQFDAATAAATNLTQKRAAQAAYNAELQRAALELRAMATSGALTAQQMSAVVTQMKALAAESARVNNARLNISGLGTLNRDLGGLIQQFAGFIPGLGQVTSLMNGLPAPIIATATALAVLTAGFASAFRTAADFQQGMADINALTQPTAAGLEDLKQAGLNLGVPLAVGGRAAAASMLELNRAGLSAQDVIEGGLVGALNLAGAAGIEAAEGGRLAVAAMTAFQLTAKDLPGVADVFANFANKTFLGARDLSMAIASVGPVAEDAGLSLNEFSGYMAVLAQGGFRRMTDAGTSFKAVLLNLLSPIGMAADAMEEINLSSYDAAGNLRPVDEILADLKGKLDGLTPQAQKDILRRLFGSDGIRAATILLREGNDQIQTMIDAMGLQGEAARVARERLESYNGTIGKLKASWERFTILVGEKLLPIMTALAKGLLFVVDGLGGLMNGAQSAVPFLAPLIGALISVRGAAIAAAAPAIWTALTTAVVAFFTTVNAWVASNPIGAIALAVSALAATVDRIMRQTADTYAEVDKANQASFDSTMARIKALTDEGTELSRAEAKYLLALQARKAAEEGTVTGVNLNPFNGQGLGTRLVSTDPDEIARTVKREKELYEELIRIRTEAARRGQSTQTGLGVSPEKLKEQKDAIKELRAALEGRAFQVKVAGLNELDAELAQVGKAFDDLRIKVKAAFGGNLNNAELRTALADLTAAQRREEAAVRARVAADKAKERAKELADAQKSARENAFAVQRAEIQAMEQGRARVAAERALELRELQASIAEQVAEYAKFPQLRAQIESDGRRQVAALRRQYQQEDLATARSNAEAVAAAEGEARAALIAAMPEGAARRQAEREAELANVRRGISDRLAALAGYPAEQARIERAGQQQLAALRQGWARDDERDARERAKRIVAAFQSAQDAQLAAQGAARDAEAARLDLDTARRVAQAGRNAQEVARIELQAARSRAALAERSARAEAQAQRETLARTTNERLTAEGITAQEQAEIRREYYARVAELDSKFSADQAKRVQDREQAERDGLERIRAAQVAAAQQPVTAAQGVVKDLEGQKALASTAAERLGIEQRLVAAQDRLRAAYQGILDRAAELRLTDEERRTLADGVTDATQAQAQAGREVANVQQELVDQARALLDSRLALVDAEGELALRMARTDAQTQAAQQRQLTAAQARLTGLDSQISGEADETKRNALLQQRLAVTGQIADLQDRTAAAPLDQERRRVTLYQAQAELLLQAAGLSDDRVAGAQLAVRTAQQEVNLAQRALDLAQTEAAQDEARTALTQKQTALLSAQAQAVQARNEGDAQALDVAEARMRAEARIAGMAEDAVAAAQLDLDLTRQRLAATRQALASPGSAGARRADLAREELELTAQQAEQERKLTAAQRDRRALLDSLTVSQGALSRALAGGTAEAQRNAQAQADLLTTRRALITAEREYATAIESSDPARQKTATDALTTAIKAQRDAVKALSDGYEKALTNMDGVRDAATRLSGVLNPDDQKGKKQEINGNTEIDRMMAIQKRRDAAANALENALRSGVAEDIRVATEEFAKQQDRYQKQVDLLRKNGIQVSESGRLRAEQLKDEVDALGIQYDREALIVEAKQRAADQEAEAARVFSVAVGAFSDSLINLRAPMSEAPTTYLYQGERFSSLSERDAFIRRAQLPTAQAAAMPDLTRLIDLLQAQQTSRTAPAAPAALPAPSHITNWDVEVTVNGAGLNPDQVANQVITKLEDRARRSGRNC